jgi:RNA polymerase sigma factor (sigma-70 family)
LLLLPTLSKIIIAGSTGSRKQNCTSKYRTRRPTPEQALDQKMAQAQLDAALETLTEEQQEVLALRFGYEMPIRDVAHTLEKSEGAIKMLQARAIAALTRRLNPKEAN